MPSFISTDDRGQFLLGGKPWFLHGVSYFGRRPGTCGANWLGQHFDHNFEHLRRDVGKMADLGLNTLGLFLPGGSCFDGVTPNEAMFAQVSRILDVVADGGLRAVVFPCTLIGKEQWCQATGVTAGEELWNPAVNVEAEKAMHHTVLEFARRYKDRPEVIGYMRRAGRLDFRGWDPPEALGSPVHSTWYTWLKRRFKADFAAAKDLLELEPQESDWTKIRMPAEMPANFARSNPRAFEYCVMQQVLISEANSRLYTQIKRIAPRQLTVNDMEGVEFPIGLLNVLVPEMATADVLWLECYNWEGMRGSHDTGAAHRIWLVEPVADRRTIDLVGNAGYVQMLVRWMQRSGKALILCHGTDIGLRRGVSTESEQALMIDRFNAYIHDCGAHGINYWCFSDDELSRSAVAPGVDPAEARKLYPQAGETMGLLRFDGSERPVAAMVRSTGRSLRNQPAADSPHEALVLFPTPIFQSLYRYRSNVTGFGIFTSLARLGILADAAFTSAGESLISVEDLARYRLIVLGINQYHRDHAEMPDRLLQYVTAGGSLLLPLAHPDQIDDPYIKPRKSEALSQLSGCAKLLSRENRLTLAPITSHHRSFPTDQTPAWTLPEDGWFSDVEAVAGAEVLARANGRPLLYRHRIGKGSVYVFTWTMDVLLFHDQQLDYLGGNWDWVFQGIATELSLTQELFRPMTRAIREMSYRSAGDVPRVVHGEPS